MNPTKKQLLDVARTYIGGNISTLEARNSDSLDFYQVSCWNLEAAFTAMFNLGFLAGKEESCTTSSAPSSQS